MIVATRREVIGGVLTALMAGAGPASAGSADDEVPAFAAGRHQLTLLRPQQSLPALRLFRLDGGTLDLAALRGAPIVLNFWASWCTACRIELPELDRLARSVGRERLHVVAVSEDRSDRDSVGRFVRSLRLTSLPICLDPNGYVAQSGDGRGRPAPFTLYGMPITYLISASGLIVGYLPGAADWSSSAAADLLDYLGRN
ncbi:MULTISPECIES: TlpA disulfide reductase family protein [unclassified Bradyrhizobium]|uniref:TlpA disulfide reductase family protein n=1 Tax=unclassified Bradyrhizobium TaxID=2631580 RepID=UPI0029160171|nr:MULTISPECIES: TlpA disulfide reductase family protein [unclassified Bradyrhizobium]